MKYISDVPRTAMEVHDMLPEGTLCEVIDNTLYMSPAPTTDHQRIIGKIYLRIGNYLEEHLLGEALMSPCDVYLDGDQHVVQPDLIFIGSAKAAIVKRKGIYGAPDLLIEILSTNIAHDKKRKLSLYERNGVSEYIIIDPETKQTWQYLLIGGKYQLQAAVPNGELFINVLQLRVSF